MKPCACWLHVLLILDCVGSAPPLGTTVMLQLRVEVMRPARTTKFFTSLYVDVGSVIGLPTFMAIPTIHAVTCTALTYLQAQLP